jgi:hypothetical protein
MVLALDRHESSVRDPPRKHQAMLKGHSSVTAAVQHQGGSCDPRQQFRNVDVSDDLQQPNCRFSRCGNSLQPIEPSHLLMRGVWDDQRCEHLARRRIVSAGTDAHWTLQRSRAPQESGSRETPRAFIRCRQFTNVRLDGHAEMARRSANWRYGELDAPHHAAFTAPHRVADLLLKIVDR